MVKTYLLLYNKNVVKNSIQELLYNIDYVLSIGGVGSEKNTLYFSYPNEGGINQIIQTSDELLIRIALSDFEKRLSTLDSSQKGQYYQCIMMDETDTSLRTVLRVLKLSPARAVTALGLVIIYLHSSITESKLEEETRLFVLRKLIDLKEKIARLKGSDETKEKK